MGSDFCYVFERTEKKYILPDETYRQVLAYLRPYMQPDEYGLTTICNVYFDTQTNELVRRSIEKPVYKEKLRLRSYGVPGEGDAVFLEIKKKWNSVVYKRRVSLRYREAEDYLYLGIKPVCDSQIMKEIEYFIRFYRPEPKVFLAYDRTAYCSVQQDGLRVTFDGDLRSRSGNLRLTAGTQDSDMKMLEGMHIMELKTHGALPIWMARMLSELEIYPTSFSKYGSYYLHCMGVQT